MVPASPHVYKVCEGFSHVKSHEDNVSSSATLNKVRTERVESFLLIYMKMNTLFSALKKIEDKALTRNQLCSVLVTWMMIQWKDEVEIAFEKKRKTAGGEKYLLMSRGLHTVRVLRVLTGRLFVPTLCDLRVCRKK